MVELRSRTNLNSHIHYIRAIKDGTIKIVINMDARRKSILKFRQLVDVYDSEQNNDAESIPRVVRDLDNVSDLTQGSCLVDAEVSIKTEPEDFNNTTLEKLRQKCKEKKRKRKRKLGQCIDTEITSKVTAKQECLTCDEECDLEEPLSTWNTKFSKKRKAKEEHKAKGGSSSTTSPSLKNGDLPLICGVKPEPCDDSYSASEAMDFIPTDPSLDINKELESPTHTELVEEIIMHDSSKDTRLALYFNAEPNCPEMKVIEDPITTELVGKDFQDASEEFTNARNVCPEMKVIEDPITTELVEKDSPDTSEEFTNAKNVCPEMKVIEDPITTELVEKDFQDASEEFTNARNVQCSLADNIALQDKEIVLYGSVPREEIELEVSQHSESENIGYVANLTALNTSSGCEGVKEDEESNDSMPNVGMNITGLEIVRVETPVSIGYPCVPLMNYGLENTESSWETEDIADELTDDALYDMLLPYVRKISLEESQLPVSLQKSSSSTHEDEAGYYKSSQVDKAPDEVRNPALSNIIVQHPKIKHQPEKLLSGRKSLSPNSQEKLRKEIKQHDSPEKGSKKSKGKLYFSSQNSHRILKAQGLENIDLVDVIPNSKQATQKANINTQKTQHQRFTNKFPRRVNRAAKSQPFSTGSTSIQECSQKAVDFSQGQMRDFQYVAERLTKELKSMKEITKRCLLAENDRSNMTDCNLDEVKTLVKNAEKTEECSKKWLSMIERDCNRFCKLMGMVKEDSPATDNNIVQKNKKIRFADDAGGDLCHIKVYEIDLNPES